MTNKSPHFFDDLDFVYPKYILFNHMHYRPRLEVQTQTDQSRSNIWLAQHNTRQENHNEVLVTHKAPNKCEIIVLSELNYSESLRNSWINLL